MDDLDELDALESLPKQCVTPAQQLKRHVKSASVTRDRDHFSPLAASRQGAFMVRKCNTCNRPFLPTSRSEGTFDGCDAFCSEECTAEFTEQSGQPVHKRVRKSRSLNKNSLRNRMMGQMQAYNSDSIPFISTAWLPGSDGSIQRVITKCSSTANESLVAITHVLSSCIAARSASAKDVGRFLAEATGAGLSEGFFRDISLHLARSGCLPAGDAGSWRAQPYLYCLATPIAVQLQSKTHMMLIVKRILVELRGNGYDCGVICMYSTINICVCAGKMLLPLVRVSSVVSLIRPIAAISTAPLELFLQCHIYMTFLLRFPRSACVVEGLNAPWA